MVFATVATALRPLEKRDDTSEHFSEHVWLRIGCGAHQQDGNGFPIFSLSPLAMHARNLMANPHCSMVVQMPGWKGLANARVTIFGDVYPLPQEHQV